MNSYSFETVFRICEQGDNVAIALKRLDAGTVIPDVSGETWTLGHTVLEGHRVALNRIKAGSPLISWGLPFGLAEQEIQAGEYVCNQVMLDALSQRTIDFELPESPNFNDQRIPFTLDESKFVPAPQVDPVDSTVTFMGYDRGEVRGVGTRNYVLLLAMTSESAAFVRQLAARFNDRFQGDSGFDGVVAGAHTEGGENSRPNNLDLLLRTLAGFVVHSNVGAVLIVDSPAAFVGKDRFEDYLRAHKYPVDEVPHTWFQLNASFSNSLVQAEPLVEKLVHQAKKKGRTAQPLKHLKVALQCGGSDAFSGVSGNPLAGWLAKELIQNGGSANLGETSELIGAEPYVLHRVRNLETARKFLKTVERFDEMAAWHGHSAEGNPSGGNLFRGLYNISIKSIGAARKKDPQVRLDYVIEYGEPMNVGGYYFMDSPGNDLESIAGQVASGCNLVLFVTGNGSITNFPFAPTLKIVTTSDRYRLLSGDMDINAGRYLDDISMEDLGAECFDLMVDTASGKRSVGEMAGHSQLQIWRDWPQNSPELLSQIHNRPIPKGDPICMDTLISPDEVTESTAVAAFAEAPSQGSLGLILPTSLCSGQVSQMIADRLNQEFENSDRPDGIKRFTALPHTEGCGVARGSSEELFVRTMCGYLMHPLVGRALLLEHGCEKTHHDEFRIYLKKYGVPEGRYGWASIQLDGGIQKVITKVLEWFDQPVESLHCSETFANPLSVGFLIGGEICNAQVDLCNRIVVTLHREGGTAVIPSGSPLLNQTDFILNGVAKQDTLDYGEKFIKNGVHIMSNPSPHLLETQTGLAATGVHVILVFNSSGVRLAAHPLVPIVQVGKSVESDPGMSPDIVLGDGTDPVDIFWSRISTIVRGDSIPETMVSGNTDFQISRGYTGFSL